MAIFHKCDCCKIEIADNGVDIYKLKFEDPDHKVIEFELCLFCKNKTLTAFYELRRTITETTP